MVLTCPGCGHLFLVGRLPLGKSVQCPICERTFIPSAAGPAEPQRAQSAPAKAAAEDIPFTLTPQSPPASNQEGWYVGTADGLEGPLNASQIAAAARAGKITPATTLQHSKKAVTILAGDVPGLFPPGWSRRDGTATAVPAGRKTAPGAPGPPAVSPKQAGAKPQIAWPVEGPGARPAPDGADLRNPLNGPDPAEQTGAAFDTALVALALSEVTEEAAPLRQEEGRGDPGASGLLGLGVARAMLRWGFRLTLALCGVATFLPWVSVVQSDPAGGSVTWNLHLFGLNGLAAASVLLSLALGVAISFPAANRRMLWIVLVLQTLGTCVAALIPFGLYAVANGGAAHQLLPRLAGGSIQGELTMAWGSWACLGLCILACAEAIVYLFLPGGTPSGPLLRRRFFVLRR